MTSPNLSDCPAPKGRPSPAQANGLGQPGASSDLSDCPAPKGRPSPAQGSALGQPRARPDSEPYKGEIGSARSVPDIALIKFNPVALQ